MSDTATILKKTALRLLLALLIAGAAFAGGYWYSTKDLDARLSQRFQAGRDAGMAAARELAVKAGLVPKAEPVLSVDGTVAEVGDGFIVFESENLAVDPFNQAPPKQRRANIGPGTKLLRATPKTAAEIAADTAAYKKALAAFTAAGGTEEDEGLPEPAAREKYATISLSDVVKGERINVAAAADITDSATIAATEVTVRAADAQSPMPGRAGAPGAAPQPGAVSPSGGPGTR